MSHCSFGGLNCPICGQQEPFKPFKSLHGPLLTLNGIFFSFPFFSFLTAPRHMEFPCQGSDLSHSTCRDATKPVALQREFLEWCLCSWGTV